MEEIMKFVVWMSSLAVAAAGGHDVRAVCDRRRTALSTAHDGPARREPEATRRAGHESLEHRHCRTVQPDAAQPGAGSAAVRPVSLSALGNFGPDQAQ